MFSSAETALGRANNDETNLDPRIYWVRGSYYAPPSSTKPALPNYMFGSTPPSLIMDKLLSLSHKKKQGLNPTYKDCVFDENGWTFSGDHWFNTITNDRSTSSLYEASDDEEGVTSSDDNPIPDSPVIPMVQFKILVQTPKILKRPPMAIAWFHHLLLFLALKRIKVVLMTRTNLDSSGVKWSQFL